MPAIVFPVSSAPGRQPQEGAGRLVNGYAVKTEQGARGPILWKGSAGLNQVFETNSYSHCRGAVLIGSTLLIVLDERVLSVTKAGTVYTVTDLGELPGTDRVTIGRNNASTPNIVAVCGAGTYNLFTDSAPTSFADGDMPSLNSICGMNGYLIGTTGSGQIWATDLNSANVQSDAYTAAQMKPDGLLRGVVLNDEFYACGTDSIEVYDEVGSTPFPLQYKNVTITPGLIATHAIAGFEDGWSNKLYYVASDFTVRGLDGYTAVRVSNSDVERAIKGAADYDAIEASVYMDGGNAFLVITSPGEWTWELNTTTGSWNERQSYGRADWRGRCAIRAFNEWIIGDATTGKFAAIDADYMLEYSDPLVWELISGANAAFPYGVAIPDAMFDFTAALGNAAGADPIETDPQVMIAWSLDGGFKWGNDVLRSLGKQGEGGRLVRVNRIGTSRGKGVRFRLRISDPVLRGFMGGQMPSARAVAA